MCVAAGIGMDHAKWSPVATAWYRLNPEVVLLKVWLCHAVFDQFWHLNSGMCCCPNCAPLMCDQLCSGMSSINHPAEDADSNEDVPLQCMQDVKGERADELMDLCKPSGSEPEGYEPLFRIEGTGAARKLTVVKTRGNEHHLEKVGLPLVSLSCRVCLPLGTCWWRKFCTLRFVVSVRWPDVLVSVAAAAQAVRGAGVGGQPAGPQGQGALHLHRAVHRHVLYKCIRASILMDHSTH